MNIVEVYGIDIVIKSMESYEKVQANNCLPADSAGLFTIQSLEQEQKINHGNIQYGFDNKRRNNRRTSQGIIY